MRDQERSPAIERIRQTLIVTQRRLGDESSFYGAADALEALAVLGRQLAERDQQLELVIRENAVGYEKLKRQLAEKDEALRLIGTPGWHDSSLSARELVDALVEIAREALRAEPAKEEPHG